jgi:hypothetical protein
MNKFPRVCLALVLLAEGQAIASVVRQRLCQQRRWLLWLFAVCLIPNANGQTLRVSPVTDGAGGWVTIQITLQDAPDREPAALEFDVNIPSSQLELESEHMARAPLPVNDAGKVLACAVARRRADIQVLHCVLAGGQKSIPSGAIVLLTLKIPERVQASTARIRVEHALGVTRDLKELPINPAEGVVNIHARQ